MKWVSIGAAKEIDVLGIGIIPFDLTICLILVFLFLMIAFFVRNRRK